MMKVELVDWMGDDVSVVNAARVSFGKKTKLLEDKDIKLINYLAEHKHMSPFGHCFASFHVKAPIFVARQLVKHKFLRWNEISRRYVDYEPEFYTPKEWRGRPVDKKQGSSGTINPEYNPQYMDCAVRMAYRKALSQGIAPEQARMLLPQSTMTEWYWSGSLDAFSDMCNLRCADDAQNETAEIAYQIDDHMSTLFPYSWMALYESGR
jgi:thymidylate synthase (FAD)